jgi:hypothetical protein
VAAGVQQHVGERVADLPGRAEHVEVAAVREHGAAACDDAFAARARRAAIDFIPEARSAELAASTIACT